MEKRVFNRKKTGIVKLLISYSGIGIVCGFIVTVAAKGLLYLTLPMVNEKISWGLASLVMIPVFSVILIHEGLKANRSDARVEIEGEIVSQFDHLNRLVARGALSTVTAIEQVRLTKSDAFIVRFANTNFVAIGDGYENSKELVDFIINQSGITPLTVDNVSLIEFGKEILNRKPIEPH